MTKPADIPQRIQELTRLNVSPEEARQWANAEIAAGKKLTWPQFNKTRKADTEPVANRTVTAKQVKAPRQPTPKRTKPDTFGTLAHSFGSRKAEQNAQDIRNMTDEEIAAKLATISRTPASYRLAIRQLIQAEAARRLNAGIKVS